MEVCGVNPKQIQKNEIQIWKPKIKIQKLI